MRCPDLPAPLREVTVPFYFGPANWQAMLGCPLRAWCRSEHAVLPPRPKAVLGTLLHAVRRRFLIEGVSGEPREGIRMLLADELERSSAGHVREIVGRLEWSDRIRRLEHWAESVGSMAKPVLRSAYRQGDVRERDTAHDRFGTGPEPHWQCRRWRLRGSPDFAFVTADGVLEITDYKTGAVFDSDDELRPEISTQLYLYAVMAETLRPDMSVRLFVHHRIREQVPWGKKERTEVLGELTDFMSANPAGRVLGAEAAAKPGPVCVGCKMRPRCAAYLASAPRWWPNQPGNPRPLPLDTWGQLVSVEENSTGRWTCVLRTSIATTVEIRGLAPSRAVSAVPLSADLFFFDLEAAEDLRQHGVHVHPRNFHELGPGRPWRTAWTMSMFRGA